jgi:2-polyprenyl-6-methoxyphenol hydroxylase-like FAD-dependent oxidoreductase
MLNNPANALQTSVLIVGAGPTGLTLACDLAGRGIAVRIVEKASSPNTASRAKGIQPRTLELFDNLGIIDEVLAAGCDYPRFRVYVWRFTLGWSMQKHRKPTAEVPYPNTWLLPQSRAEEVLRARLAQFGQAVEFATEITDVSQDPSGVTATLLQNHRSSEIRADFLIGADGGHSFIRKAIGAGFEGETRDTELMLIGDVRVNGLARDYWHVWPKARGGTVALCPLPGTDCFQFTAQLPAGAPPPNLSHFDVQDFFHAATGSAATLHDPAWMSIYRPNIRMVDRYRFGRVFLAGDAAHVHPPTGGQGLNTGVQDAFNLGWKLALVLRGASQDLLDTYEEERLPIAAGVLGISTRLHRQTVRHGLFPQRRGAKTKQLALHYRGRSLSCDEGPARSTPRAGDRAPDALCRTPEGAQVRLFDLFRGPHSTLLAFGHGHENLVAETNRCFAPFVRAHHLAGPRQPEILLVRPDGYIGLATRNPGSVSKYLRQVLKIPESRPGEIMTSWLNQDPNSVA